MLQVINDKLNKFVMVRTRKSRKQASALICSKLGIDEPVKRRILERVCMIGRDGVGPFQIGIARNQCLIECRRKIRFLVQLFLLVWVVQAQPTSQKLQRLLGILVIRGERIPRTNLRNSRCFAMPLDPGRDQAVHFFELLGLKVM